MSDFSRDEADFIKRFPPVDLDGTTESPKAATAPSESKSTCHSLEYQSTAPPIRVESESVSSYTRYSIDAGVSRPERLQNSASADNQENNSMQSSYWDDRLLKLWKASQAGYAESPNSSEQDELDFSVTAIEDVDRRLTHGLFLSARELRVGSLASEGADYLGQLEGWSLMTDAYAALIQKGLEPQVLSDLYLSSIERVCGMSMDNESVFERERWGFERRIDDALSILERRHDGVSSMPSNTRSSTKGDERTDASTRAFVWGSLAAFGVGLGTAAVFACRHYAGTASASD